MNNDSNNTINNNVTSQEPVTPTNTVAGSPVAPTTNIAGSPVTSTNTVAGSPVVPTNTVAGSPVTPTNNVAGSPVAPTNNVAGTPVAPTTNVEPKITIGDEKQPLPSGEIKAKTSSKKMILFAIIIVILAAIFIYLLKGKSSSSPVPEASSNTPTVVPATPTPTPVSLDAAILLENVKIAGNQCINSKCEVTLESEGNSVQYNLDTNKNDLFLELSDYDKYIKVNAYYVQKDATKSIIDYKMFIKSTNEEINDVKTEEELREKLGLFKIGNYTESLKLSNIGTVGSGYENNTSYTYKELTFVDSKNNEYEMKYKNPDNNLNLTVGNNYTVAFGVTKGSFEYEYTITSIK